MTTGRRRVGGSAGDARVTRGAGSDLARPGPRWAPRPDRAAPDPGPNLDARVALRGGKAAAVTRLLDPSSGNLPHPGLATWPAGSLTFGGAWGPETSWVWRGPSRPRPDSEPRAKPGGCAGTQTGPTRGGKGVPGRCASPPWPGPPSLPSLLPPLAPPRAQVATRCQTRPGP